MLAEGRLWSEDYLLAIHQDVPEKNVTDLSADTFDGIHQDQSTIAQPGCRRHFRCEIDMSRGVDEIQDMMW